MSEPNIVVYGAPWCPDCRQAKQFLGEHQIPYRWVDIEEDKASERLVMETNGGKRIIPTIVFADGSVLVEPSNAALAARLGLRTKANRSHYEFIVVGGGPAGLTAALYAAREGIGTLVIERAAPGGQAAATGRIDNLPGFVDGVGGAEFGDNLRRQAERFGSELLQAQEVTRIHSHDNYHCVELADGTEYSARALLIATGSRYRRLNVPGEQNYIGAGIHFCATCDGPFYRGQPLVVVGGGNSAVEESLHLTQFADQITLLVRGDHLTASQVAKEELARNPSIGVRYHTEVAEFRGAGGKLKSILIRDTRRDSIEELHPAGAFVFIGLEPNTRFLEGTAVLRTAQGFVVTGHALVHGSVTLAGFSEREPTALETSVPCVFAAGDVRLGSTKQVASAAGEGATAALLVREHLRST